MYTHAGVVPAGTVLGRAGVPPAAGGPPAPAATPRISRATSIGARSNHHLPARSVR